MNKKDKIQIFISIFIILSIFIIVIVFPLIARSESAKSSNGSVSASLGFKVIIKQSLYLKIGSEGATVDTVKFETTNTSDGQKTVAGDIKPTIEVAALVNNDANITISVDSTSGLHGENMGNIIPLSKISSTGTGDFSSINNKNFDGTSNQTVWESRGSGIRKGALAFAFNNSQYYQADTYTGKVVYTLGSP